MKAVILLAALVGLWAAARWVDDLYASAYSDVLS